MRDQRLTVDLHSGKKAYALLTGGWQKDVLIVMHCYGSDMRTTLPYLASRYFAERGISVLRFNLYDGWHADARNLSDPSLTQQDHVRDLVAMMEYAVSNGALQVHVAAHSLSAYTALIVGSNSSGFDLKPASVILWDGSHPIAPPLSIDDKLRLPAHGYYVGESGTGVTISRSYFESTQDFRICHYCDDWSTPVQIVAAANGVLLTASKVYQQHLGKWARRVVVDGADHHFIEDDEWNRDLFSCTLEWLQDEYLTVG